jgi:hypothetical protein
VGHEINTPYPVLYWLVRINLETKDYVKLIVRILHVYIFLFSVFHVVMSIPENSLEKELVKRAYPLSIDVTVKYTKKSDL